MPLLNNLSISIGVYFFVGLLIYIFADFNMIFLKNKVPTAAETGVTRRVESAGKTMFSSLLFAHSRELLYFDLISFTDLPSLESVRR